MNRRAKIEKLNHMETIVGAVEQNMDFVKQDIYT